MTTPPFQHSTTIGGFQSLCDETIALNQTSESSVTGYPNFVSDTSVPEIDSIDVIEYLPNRSDSSLSMLQTTNSRIDFDQNHNFIPSSESDYLNFNGAYENAIFNTQHDDSANRSHGHPAMSLVQHNKGNISETSTFDSQQEPSTTSSPTQDGQSKGWLSPLHIAARRGHKSIVRTLLSHNIDCNEKDSDMLTAIIHASIDGHEHVARLLLAQGAHISDVDRWGRSAIYWAIMNRHEPVLRVLLEEYDKREWEQGIVTYDDMGWTALHIAIEKGFDAGVQLLLGSGADLNAQARKTCNGDDDRDDSRIVQAE